MADEYIDKVEVGAKIQMMYIHREMDYGGENDFCRGMRKALRIIENMPAADVQPVKQWVKLHDKHPDTEGFYLVCDQYGECEMVEYLPDIKSWFTHKIKGRNSVLDALTRTTKGR